MKVFDGDTFLIQIEGQEEIVRLREIDAPEIRYRTRAGQEPWGTRAREFALSRVQGKTVRLEVEDHEERDSYQRLLAYIFLKGLSINQEMVRAGHAFFYPGLFRGKYADELERAEEKARKAGLGIWDPKQGLKERPQEFRFRLQREENPFFESGKMEQGGKGRFSPKGMFPKDKVVRNRRSMIYHLPGTRGAASVSPQNRRLFDSPEDAEKAGYRRSKSLPARGLMDP